MWKRMFFIYFCWEENFSFPYKKFQSSPITSRFTIFNNTIKNLKKKKDWMFVGGCGWIFWSFHFKTQTFNNAFSTRIKSFLFFCFRFSSKCSISLNTNSYLQGSKKEAKKGNKKVFCEFLMFFKTQDKLQKMLKWIPNLRWWH